MKRSDQAARLSRRIDDLKPALDWRWKDLLGAWASKGYPTGGDNTGGSSDISRPTERFALSPDTIPAQKLHAVERLEQQLADLAREYHSLYLWTITAAKYDGPEPVPCQVLLCDHEISNIGNDVPRNGRCPRCAKHWSRYGLEYPQKPTRHHGKDGAAS